MKLTRRFWLVSLIIIMVGIGLSACGGNDEDKDTPIPPTATIPPTTVPTFQPAPTLPNPIDVRNQPSSEQAAVWVIQGVTGLPNVDVYLNDTLIVPRMTFNAITSRALPVNAGSYQFSLVQAGQSPETEGAVLFEEACWWHPGVRRRRPPSRSSQGHGRSDPQARKGDGGHSADLPARAA